MDTLTYEILPALMWPPLALPIIFYLDTCLDNEIAFQEDGLFQDQIIQNA